MRGAGEGSIKYICVSVDYGEGGLMCACGGANEGGGRVMIKASVVP